MIFSGVILGHLVGDYLLQGEWMAVNKKTRSLEGFLACFIHCSIWSLCVIYFGEMAWTAETYLLVYVSHAILDQTYLASGYMKYANIFGHGIRKNDMRNWKWTKARVLQYALVDNTFHLLFIWGMMKAGWIC